MKNNIFTFITDWLTRAPQRPLLVILGPTASGKTEFAIQLALKFKGEIISADSRQIYRELEIGSAKPTATELQKIKHHLISEFSPQDSVNVAEYRNLAEQKIEEILRRGKLPILCGGHTLLISAIVENYQFPPNTNPKRRGELTKIYDSKNGAQKLWNMLAKLDLSTAEKIPINNRHHLIRAYERAENCLKATKSKRKFDTLLLGLNPTRETLYKNINKRVDKMMSVGLLDEVEKLAKKYERYSPALRGHGYRELLDFLAGEKTLDRAVEEIKRDTRNYAKRQRTWWRNSPLSSEIFWIKLEQRS